MTTPTTDHATQAPAGDVPAERQRRREGMIILSAALAVLLFAFFETRLPQFSSSNSLSNNVIFFLLINLNIILLVLLVFLVARNLLKLVFERRRRILGSHLRTRLVLAFLAVSIFPAILIFLVALGFMTSSIENWFNVQVEGSLSGSLEVAQAYYRNASENALVHARQLADRVREDDLLAAGGKDRLQAFVADKQREYNVGTVQVFGIDRDVRAMARADEVPGESALAPSAPLADRGARRAPRDAHPVDGTRRRDPRRGADRGAERRRGRGRRRVLRARERRDSERRHRALVPGVPSAQDPEAADHQQLHRDARAGDAARHLLRHLDGLLSRQGHHGADSEARRRYARGRAGQLAVPHRPRRRDAGRTRRRVRHARHRVQPDDRRPRDEQPRARAAPPLPWRRSSPS